MNVLFESPSGGPPNDFDQSGHDENRAPERARNANNGIPHTAGSHAPERNGQQRNCGREGERGTHPGASVLHVTR